MHFINTRPLDRADELTQALAAQGFRVECLPLLELVKQPFDAHLNAQSSVEVGQGFVKQKHLRVAPGA